MLNRDERRELPNAINCMMAAPRVMVVHVAYTYYGYKAGRLSTAS